MTERARRAARARSLVFWSCLASETLLGLDPRKALTQYSHQEWTTDTGLPQNSVQAITQTRDGYIWLGTQEGLARFDGARFTVFDDKNAPALKNHHVLVLFAGRDGSLWVGTRGGGLVRFREGTFTAFTRKEGLPNNVVRSLHEDHQGRLWIGTEGGLGRLDAGRVVPAYTGKGDSSDNVVMAIAEAEGALWFGTDGGGLHRLRNGVMETLTRQNGLSSDVIRALYTDRDGSLWIGTRGGGLNRLQAGRIRNYPTQNGLWGTVLGGAIARDRDGNLWVGTRGGGLLRLRGDGFETLTKKQGFSSDIVICVYEDREGGLWIGTDGEGLSRLKDGKFTTYSTQEGLSHDLLLPIFEDRQGSLWMGSYGGGLNRFREGRFTAYTTKNGLSSDMVVSLSEDRQGSLWIGTDGGGLNQFREGQFTRYGAREGLPNNRVISLHGDRHGDLWIGTYGGGLARFTQGRFTTYGVKEGLSSDRIPAISEDHAGNLWIGTDGGGLDRFKDGRFTVYTAKDGLSHDTVYRIYEDSDETLWIGTYGGLSRLRQGRFTSYTTKDGLFDNKIFQILEGDDGNLWMSCNRGIFRVSKKQLNDFAERRIRALTSVVYGKADGMKSNECNGTSQPAGWKTRDGRLWFPTTGGAVTVDPKNMRINELPPPVVVEEVVIDKRHVDVRRTERLPPGRGEIEIHYTALSFADPTRVRFRYQLEGYDPIWVDAGPRRVAFYTNIPPGPYRFRVMACNNDGIWNEKGASFAFSLRPHFYQAYWFYGICALGVALFAWGGYRLRVRQLVAREKKLSLLVSERTQELERANRMLSVFSYLDSLTGIGNRRNFEDSLDSEWRRAYRQGIPLSLLMIDIDHFKAFNDAYGHPKGDECLKKVAVTIRNLLNRPGDLCARYGGEEFAVILPDTPREGASAVAEALRASVEALQMEHGRSSAGRFVTISVGVACAHPTQNAPASSLVATADQALYQAKEAGRNRVCLANSALPVASAQIPG